jgi:transposase
VLIIGTQVRQAGPYGPADPTGLCETVREAATRPSMRLAPVKGEARQAGAVVFRAWELLVRRRTQCINALHGHLVGYG